MFALGLPPAKHTVRGNDLLQPISGILFCHQTGEGQGHHALDHPKDVGAPVTGQIHKHSVALRKRVSVQRDCDSVEVSGPISVVVLCTVEYIPLRPCSAALRCATHYSRKAPAIDPARAWEYSSKAQVVSRDRRLGLGEKSRIDLISICDSARMTAGYGTVHRRRSLGALLSAGLGS